MKERPIYVSDAFEDTPEYQQIMSSSQQQQMSPQETSAFEHSNLLDENLIKWQLELDNILQRVDHLLRGHKLKFDPKTGSKLWIEPQTDEEKMLNDYGVCEFMRILSMYLNRNTILTNLSEELINEKMYSFGIEFTDLIFTQYSEMGLNSKSKRERFPIIVLSVMDTIHFAFLRALNGEERRSLREARTVVQNISGTPQQPMGMGYPMQPQRQGFSLFNPRTWFKMGA